LSTNVNMRTPENSLLSFPVGKSFPARDGISLPLFLSSVLVSGTYHSLTSYRKQCTSIWRPRKWFSLMGYRIQSVSELSVLPYLQGTFTSSLGKTFPINLAVTLQGAL
jgi:hypothetical protein